MFDTGTLYQGLILALEPANLGWLLAGYVLGVVVGAIPGFSEGTFLALILPFTLYMDPWSALIMMTAVYVGAESAGNFPSILLNMPGTVGTVATTFEGFPLTLKGLAGQALGASITASAAGGILGAMAFMFIGPLVGVYANKFNSPEMFLVAMFGLTAVASVTGESVVKGLVSAAMGLLLAASGADLIVGVPRATFGFGELAEGVPLLPALIGLFGFAEILRQAGKDFTVGNLAEYPRFSGPFGGMIEALRHRAAIVRSTVIGLIIGMIPGVGTATATMVSYGQARRWSRRPNEYGHGSFEGLVSTDSANNACIAGALIPTLALGVPGSGATAVMLAALMLHGLRPGPGFWEKFPVEAYTLGFATLISTLLMLVSSFVLVRMISRVAYLPTRILTPLVALFCIVGVYSYRGFLFDVALMVVFGLLGYILTAHRYSAPALLLGIILGPVAEENFFRSLQLDGPLIFFSSPLCLVLLACSVVAVGLPSLTHRIGLRESLTRGLDSRQ